MITGDTGKPDYEIYHCKPLKCQIILYIAHIVNIYAKKIMT